MWKGGISQRRRIKCSIMYSKQSFVESNTWRRSFEGFTKFLRFCLEWERLGEKVEPLGIVLVAEIEILCLHYSTSRKGPIAESNIWRRIFKGFPTSLRFRKKSVKISMTGCEWLITENCSSDWNSKFSTVVLNFKETILCREQH